MAEGRSLGPRGEAAPVMVVVGAMAPDEELARAAVAELAAPLGGIGLEGRWAAFDQTGYYEPEMGPHLVRTYCACAGLVAAESLVDLKHRAWQVEQEHSTRGRRRVNLDPGVLDLGKLVLASFKPGPYKLYLGRGVWADLVLHYSDGAFRPLPWTFPDLREGRHQELFDSARRRYKELLRSRDRAARPD